MYILTYTQGVRKTLHPTAQTVPEILDELTKGHIPWSCDLILPAEKQ